MTRDEYEKQKSALRKAHNEQLKELAEEFALENSIADIGDFVTDHYHTVKVENIRVSIQGPVPGCVYYGTTWLKSLKSQTKKPEYDACYQCNVVQVGTQDGEVKWEKE
jgi:hypothetical protein